MIDMELTKTEISYCLEMTNDEFTAIIDKDEKSDLNSCLYSLLEKIGCTRVEYDGFFGPNIFFTVPFEQDELTDQVIKVIKDYLKD